ncbi:Glutamate 5-kinase [Rhizoctonia solani]|uniref:Glutamate 5-kinase n=1 Tax=Rhizoctonia solani TaxID=456999 RepID=A0A8H7LJK5_9AGAM|nr:Glutamate 5-kinase [Rhizoctonia solani]
MASRKARATSTAHSLTIVIKLGTSSIVHEKTHQPLLSLLSSIVETVVNLKNEGHRVVLVSSGAIGVGLKRMDMASRPKSVSGKQALAAIGQGRLIALWDNLFGQLGQPIAQVLLTRGDISDRTRYLNAVNTLSELLSMGVVPIINENDTISVSEIKFGDNDTLSAITSSMLHADYLFLLTDVDSLYTANPRKDPSARAIEVVESVSTIRTQVSTATLGSSLGTGGMETKLIAAEIATAAGVATVITSSKDPTAIFRIIAYNTAAHTIRIRDAAHALLPSTTLPPSTPETPAVRTPAREITPAHTPLRKDLVSSTELPPKTAHPESKSEGEPMTTKEELPSRPPHTLFTPSLSPLRDLKSWTTHTLYPAGSVIIDVGAHVVLSRRSSGGRLLPAGVLGVSGAFAGGQAVRIMVKRKVGGPSDVEVDAIVLANRKDKVAVVEVGSVRGIDSAGPDSPLLLATVPTGLPDMMDDQVALSGRVSPSEPRQEELQTSGDNRSPNSAEAESREKIDDKSGDNDGWEVVEVGRGLANYNSAEITKVMGHKSSAIASILGYADSEYVVEHITIRVPP